MVVKFAPVYNKKAHTLLEEASLAPKLWFCERVPEVSNWYVIVMSHVVEDFGPVKSNPTAIKALRAVRPQQRTFTNSAPNNDMFQNASNFVSQIQ